MNHYSDLLNAYNQGLPGTFKRGRRKGETPFLGDYRSNPNLRTMVKDEDGRINVRWRGDTILRWYPDDWIHIPYVETRQYSRPNTLINGLLPYYIRVSYKKLLGVEQVQILWERPYRSHTGVCLPDSVFPLYSGVSGETWLYYSVEHGCHLPTTPLPVKADRADLSHHPEKWEARKEVLKDVYSAGALACSTIWRGKDLLTVARERGLSIQRMPASVRRQAILGAEEDYLNQYLLIRRLSGDAYDFNITSLSEAHPPTLATFYKRVYAYFNRHMRDRYVVSVMHPFFADKP